MATLIAPAPVSSKKIDLRKQVHNLVLGRIELTHVNDLQAVVKKIVGKKGEEDQLMRERVLLLQFLGILGVAGEKNALIKARALSPVGQLGKERRFYRGRQGRLTLFKELQNYPFRAWQFLNSAYYEWLQSAYQGMCDRTAELLKRCMVKLPLERTRGC